MSGTLPVGPDPWRVTPEERLKHEEQFMHLKPVGGYVTGEQAKGFFLQSQLPPIILGHIWALADINADGKMDKNEFSIAMKLIQMKLKGFEVPKALPPSLKMLVAPPALGVMGGGPSLIMGPHTNIAPVTSGVLTSQIPNVGMIGTRPLGSTMMVAPPPSVGAAPSGFTLNHFRPTPRPMTNGSAMIGQGVIGGSAIPPSSGVISMNAGFVRPASPVDAKVQRSGSVTSQDSPTGSVGSPLQEWAVPHQSKLKYTQIFNTHDRTRTGYLTGHQARNILVHTGLPQNILAQIWSLSDIDNDGKLTCEEFCLAMHLADSVKAGDKLPAALPADLIPPSYRRVRSSSIQGGTNVQVLAGTTSLINDIILPEAEEPDDKRRPSLATFEDKRRENFEKGQAELEKRRQALVESQRREQEERERKDREEQERKERIRQEQERRRQMELEKQLAKQRELEQEKEEQRRKVMEQREAARREMERQRQLEWEKQRRQELMTQRQKEQEKVLQLKARNQSLTIELEQLNEKIKTLNSKLSDSRNDVNNLKGVIDEMRATRDKKLNELESTKNEMKNLNQKMLLINQEKVSLQNQVRSNMAGNPTVESFNIVMHSFNNKHITLKQLKEKLANLESETSQKLQDIDNNNSQLQEIQKQLAELIKEGESTYEIYLAKRNEVIELRRKNGLADIPPEGTNKPWNDDEWIASSTAQVTSANNTAWGAEDNWDVKEQAVPAWGTTANDDWATSGTTANDDWATSGTTANDDWATSGTTANDDWATSAAAEEPWGTSDQQSSYKWDNEGDSNWAVTDTPAAATDSWPIATEEAAKEENAQVNSVKTKKYRTLYAFEARNPDELSIEPGDIIMVPEGLSHEPGWLGGDLRGKTGWFPEAYVELIVEENDKEPATELPKEESPPTSTGLQETVHIVGTEMKMTLTGIQEAAETASDNGSILEAPFQESQPPSAFIQVSKISTSGTVSPIPGKGTSTENLQAQALFPWRAKKENHLTFNKGDVITVKEQQDMWWFGETENGKSGWFPKSYVKLIAGPWRAADEEHSQENGQAETAPESVTSPVAEYYEAMYSYQSSEAGDLSFVQGNIIMITKKEGDWWTGIIEDRVGVFPSNYVKKIESKSLEVNADEALQDSLGEMPDVVPQEAINTEVEVEPNEYQPTEIASEDNTGAAQQQREAPEPPRSPKVKHGKKPEIAMVIAPYVASGPEQLSLQRGQLIQIRKKSQNGWWEGELQAKGKKRQLGWFPASYVKQLSSSARNTPEPGQEQVIAMYPYEAQNEDELNFQKGAIITIVSKDDGAWWKGEFNGAVGLFPANYVQPLDAHQTNTQSSSAVQWLKDLMGLPVNERKRQEAIMELINTEQTYMDDMSIVLDAFHRPLKEAKVCTDQELEIIFVNWKELIACNRKLLKAFCVRKKMSPNGIISIVGDVLCENLPHMTAYIRFCSRQLNAASLIQNKTENKPEFKKVCRMCCRDPRTKGMPLSSFLLKPMQRITKYPLLIKKILKYTPDNHPDFVYLEDALSHAEELCNQVNEGVREKENSDRLEWIQQHVQCDGLMEKITFNSMTNSLGPRKFLHSGTLIKAKSNKELEAFLFNDFLLLTQPQKLLGSVTSLLNFDKISNMQFRVYKQPLFLNEIMIKLPQDTEDDTHFQINHIDRTYNMKTNSPTERNLWVKKLEEASQHYIQTDRKKREKAHSFRRKHPKGKLRIIVIEADELMVNPVKGHTDPYCEVSMGSQEFRTKIISDSINPKWNASMQFIVKDVEQDVLCITVFDRDYFSPNDFLGRTEVRVADILRESRNINEPLIKKLLLYEVESGEVIVKLDLQLFES